MQAFTVIAWQEGLFLFFMIIMGLTIATGGIMAIAHGSLLITPVVGLIASPFIPILVAVAMEGRTFDSVTDVDHSSWMFLFGDTYCLPFAGIMFAWAWKQDANFIPSWAHKPWWPAVALAGGIAAGLWFHWHSWQVYDVARLNSPSKVIHDYLSYPVLGTLLLYGGVPALVGVRGRPRWHLVVALLGLIIGVGGWLGVGLYNGEFAGRLDPAWLHPLWDWSSLTVIPDA